MCFDRSMMKKIIVLKEDAVALYDSQAALARELNLTRAAVSAWPAGKPIPDAHALRLYYQLHPDVFQAA